MTWTTRPDLPAGHRVTATEVDAYGDQIDSLTAPGWTTYVPVWTSGGTQPVLNNGTLSGRYRQPFGGDVVEVQIVLTMGSTSTFGTGAYLLSLPVAGHASDIYVGVVRLLDSGTIDRPGCTKANTSTTVLIISDSGAVTNTVPWTWATGDQIVVHLFYQPA
jgi:hypothetical protein